MVAVSTPYDAKGLLKAAIRDEDPVVFLEPKRLYRSVKEEVPEEDYTLPIGKAALRREGKDLSLIAYGAVMPEVLQAAEELAKAGVSAEVLDLRSLMPWDYEAVMHSVAKTGRAVLVADAPRHASFLSEVAATIAEDILDMLLAPPLRVTGFDTPYPYAQDKLYMPTVTRILNAAKRALDY